MSNKFPALIIFISFFLLLFPGCQTKEGSWPQIQQRGILRIGVDPTFPPFEAADDTGLYGLDVDLARALASDLGLETEFVYFGYDGLYDALGTKQVDMLLSALVPIPGRTKDFAYSEPYFNAGEILIVAKDEKNIQSVQDLAGHQLAVELGALGHVEATELAKQLPDLTLKPHPSVDEALLAVADGQADAALVDSVSGRLFLRDLPEGDEPLSRLEDPVTVEPYVMVVRIEDEMLLTRLNEALRSLTASGDLDRLTQKWLGD